MTTRTATWRRWSLALLCSLLAGCETSAFYWQAAQGQWQILRARQPITTLLDDPALDATTRTKLTLVLKAREFAAERLHLPVANHYSSYVALDRSAVVWNVFAAPPDSTTPTTWCFPIAGCVAYRGYFAEADARAYADKLARQGLDTYVGGVGAYSTLGWFDDPVLSTFLYDDPDQLAALLFHELAHQQLYVPDDSTFNESFATAVELIALHWWLTDQGEPARFARAKLNQQRQQAFVQLILTHRRERQARYDQRQADEGLDTLNAALKAQLLQEYQALKASWQGYAGYDRWFQGPLNNAQLATVATYNTLLAGFIGLFHHLDEDIQAFYTACATLAEQEKSARHAQIQGFSEALPNDSLYFSVTP